MKKFILILLVTLPLCAFAAETGDNFDLIITGDFFETDFSFLKYEIDPYDGLYHTTGYTTVQYLNNSIIAKKRYSPFSIGLLLSIGYILDTSQEFYMFRPELLALGGMDTGRIAGFLVLEYNLGIGLLYDNLRLTNIYPQGAASITTITNQGFYFCYRFLFGARFYLDKSFFLNFHLTYRWTLPDDEFVNSKPFYCFGVGNTF